MMLKLFLIKDIFSKKNIFWLFLVITIPVVVFVLSLTYFQNQILSVFALIFTIIGIGGFATKYKKTIIYFLILVLGIIVIYNLIRVPDIDIELFSNLKQEGENFDLSFSLKNPMRQPIIIDKLELEIMSYSPKVIQSKHRKYIPTDDLSIDISKNQKVYKLIDRRIIIEYGQPHDIKAIVLPNE